jgi:hypothetical protein
MNNNMEKNNKELKIVNNTFKIDFDKVKSLEDVIIILKSLDMSINWYSDDCPSQFKEIYEKGLLKK